MSNLIIFFIQYIYPNVSTMKKFLKAFQKDEVDEEAVSLPFSPMQKQVCSNPKIVIGMTGVRHVQKQGGLGVWPVFYLMKEQVSYY